METMKTPVSTHSEGHDRLFGQDFKGSPCHLRVLKPPGGGSSDIFGAPEPVESPRRARNAIHMQSSSVLGPAAGETPRAAKPGNNSHDRLFGPDSPSLFAKNKSRSNILIGDDELDKGMEVLAPSSEALESPLDGGDVMDGVVDGVVDDGQVLATELGEATTEEDGNPLTGEGYSHVNGESQPIAAPMSNGVSNGPSSNGPVPNNSSNHATPQRSRVPPGGYSSGLW